MSKRYLVYKPARYSPGQSSYDEPVKLYMDALHDVASYAAFHNLQFRYKEEYPSVSDPKSPICFYLSESFQDWAFEEFTVFRCDGSALSVDELSVLTKIKYRDPNLTGLGLGGGYVGEAVSFDLERLNGKRQLAFLGIHFHLASGDEALFRQSLQAPLIRICGNNLGIDTQTVAKFLDDMAPDTF